MIEIKNLHKRFGSNKVLQGVNLDILPGETLEGPRWTSP